MNEKMVFLVVLQSVFLLSLCCFSGSALNGFASMADFLTSEDIRILDSFYDRSTLQSFTDPLFAVRHVNSPGHENVRKYLVEFLQCRHYIVEEDTFTGVMPNGTQFVGSNIIASTDHVSSSTRRLILACHWDSKYEKSYSFVGATDSSVPCGMLLWIANALRPVFSDHNNRQLLHNSGVALQFVFFDGEEAIEQWTATDSIYGARHLAEKWEGEGKLSGIELLVLLDLLGAPHPKFYSFFENTHDFFVSLGESENRLQQHWISNGDAATNMRKVFGALVRAPGMIEDDHIPFLRRNVPILHMIPYPFPRVWHTRDDIKENIHWPVIDRLTKVFTVFTMRQLNALIRHTSGWHNNLYIPEHTYFSDSC